MCDHAAYAPRLALPSSPRLLSFGLGYCRSLPRSTRVQDDILPGQGLSWLLAVALLVLVFAFGWHKGRHTSVGPGHGTSGAGFTSIVGRPIYEAN